MTDNHTFIVTFRINPDYHAAFSTLLKSVHNELPSVPGCRSIRVLRHPEDENTFTLIEEWVSKASHTAHIDGLVASGSWAKIEAMLHEPPTSQYWAPFQLQDE